VKSLALSIVFLFQKLASGGEVCHFYVIYQMPVSNSFKITSKHFCGTLWIPRVCKNQFISRPETNLSLFCVLVLFNLLMFVCFAFGVSILLIWHQEEHLACENWVISLEQSAGDLHMD